MCFNQVERFLSDPFVLTFDTNYHNWSYEMPALTVCSDFQNGVFARKFYRRTTNLTTDLESKNYRDFLHDMRIIGSIAADTMYLINRLRWNTTILQNLSGEELLDVVINVYSLHCTCFNSFHLH